MKAYKIDLSRYSYLLEKDEIYYFIELCDTNKFYIDKFDSGYYILDGNLFDGDRIRIRDEIQKILDLLKKDQLKEIEVAIFLTNSNFKLRKFVRQLYKEKFIEALKVNFICQSKLKDIRILYLNYSNPNKLLVYFDENDWYFEYNGLLYGDNQFLSDLRNNLIKLGFKLNSYDLTYASIGQQYSDCVHFEVTNNFNIQWLNYFKTKS